MHFPSDFGRDKRRPAGAVAWGAGHELNNGHLTVSPVVNGNAVLGGGDPDTGMPYGFNLAIGTPDPGRTTAAAESFAGVLQALGADTAPAELPVPAMRKG